MIYLKPLEPLHEKFASLIEQRRLIRGLRDFQRKIVIHIERGNYEVKTAETAAEVEGAQRLRYEVFYREFSNRENRLERDFDSFDLVADHLIIIDRRVRKVVGTYRILSSLFTKFFYSQTEFSADEFFARDGVKNELSRACIHPEHRKGAVMGLLWKGVAEYMRLTNASFLFGCSSVKTTDPRESALIVEHLERREKVDPQIVANPLIEYDIPDLDVHRKAWKDREVDVDWSAVGALIPPLFAAYFRAGAKVGARPALDREFACIDFFTVLEWKKLEASFARW